MVHIFVMCTLGCQISVPTRVLPSPPLINFSGIESSLTKIRNFLTTSLIKTPAYLAPKSRNKVHSDTILNQILE